MATTVSQTTIHKPSSDSYKKVTAKKYLTVSRKQDSRPADNQTNSIIIPTDAMTVLNSYFACDLDPNSNVILESDSSKLQCKMSSQETALCSSNHLDHPTSSTNQFSHSNQNIAVTGQQSSISCTPNQATTNSDSKKKDSQNHDFQKRVSPTSDISSSVSIFSDNSESGNEEGVQNNILNRDQVLLTDSDFSSDSSNNCVSKTT
ncbi:unnamed protein product [Mytilus coruscus]|uniref:Uncharacterized protein n=1 Tax=Mytilus coruscus TaxID=42192 RepID=A0A6J8C3V9_MYTCO|nr:unnamed protein product [Mytilus coruscus]